MALLFIGVTALICLVNFIAKDKECSEKENRMLTQKPAVTWAGIESGRFMSQYESYKSDQFAGRDLWVSLKTSVDLLSGKRESNGVFKGKDHYLLEEIKTPGEQNGEEPGGHPGLRRPVSQDPLLYGACAQCGQHPVRQASAPGSDQRSGETVPEDPGEPWVRCDLGGSSESAGKS